MGRFRSTHRHPPLARLFSPVPVGLAASQLAHAIITPLLQQVCTPASVVKLVDARDSKSRSERSVGSIPTRGTIWFFTHFRRVLPRVMPFLPPVTQALMLAYVGLFALDTLVDGQLFMWLALWPIGSDAFFPWQVLSYGFVHTNAQVLIFSMLGFVMFAAELERHWGGRRLLVLVLVGTVVGGITQAACSFMFGLNQPGVGTGGALFGMLVAYALAFPYRQIMPLIPPIPMSARTLVIIYGVLELVLGFSSGRAGISHLAQLAGGLLGAWLLVRFWRGQSPFSRR